METQVAISQKKWANIPVFVTTSEPEPEDGELLIFIYYCNISYWLTYLFPLIVTRSLAVKKTDSETKQRFQLSITLTRAHKHWDREF